MKQLLSTGVLVAGLISNAMASELQRQHGAHVHGQAIGTLALDDGRVHLELDIPGANLVGFEHSPRTDEQAETLAGVIKVLESGQWLVADARGQCEISEITVHTPGFGKSDDHGHENNHHSHDHAEFRVAALLECQAPGQLRWLDIGLFDDYPGNEHMTIDVLTGTLATRARLAPGRKRIDLVDS